MYSGLDQFSEASPIVFRIAQRLQNAEMIPFGQFD